MILHCLATPYLYLWYWQKILCSTHHSWLYLFLELDSMAHPWLEMRGSRNDIYSVMSGAQNSLSFSIWLEQLLALFASLLTYGPNHWFVYGPSQLLERFTKISHLIWTMHQWLVLGHDFYYNRWSEAWEAQNLCMSCIMHHIQYWAIALGRSNSTMLTWIWSLKLHCTYTGSCQVDVNTIGVSIQMEGEMEQSNSRTPPW